MQVGISYNVYREKTSVPNYDILSVSSRYPEFNTHSPNFLRKLIIVYPDAKKKFD